VFYIEFMDIDYLNFASFAILQVRLVWTQIHHHKWFID